MSAAAHPDDTVTAVEGAGAVPDLTAFRRLHPSTPFLRGWKWLLAGGAVLSRDAIGRVDVAQILLTMLAVLVVGAAAGAVSWWRTQYGIVGGDLRIESGVLFRRSRRVRLDRLQAVDVVRPLAARLLGVSELRLEVAGGAKTEAPLAYLSEQDARDLRAQLLARAAGLDERTPEAPERPLLSVPLAALIGSTLLSSSFLTGVVITVLLVAGVVVSGELWLVGPVLPAALGTATAIYRQLVANYGFTVSESPDGVRIRKGLLDTRAQTVPPGRVQGVAIVQPLLWRRPGWVRVDVDVAGYAGGSGDAAGGSPSTLLPVAPRPLAVDLVRRVLPGVEVDAVPLVGAPPAARWLRPLGWRRLAVGADARVIVTQEGVLQRVTTLVPHAKTQSVRFTQGPLQRRLGLASVHVDTIPGPVDAVARHRRSAEAARMVEDQAERARTARRSAEPERWMQQ